MSTLAPGARKVKVNGNAPKTAAPTEPLKPKKQSRDGIFTSPRLMLAIGLVIGLVAGSFLTAGVAIAGFVFHSSKNGNNANVANATVDPKGSSASTDNPWEGSFEDQGVKVKWSIAEGGMTTGKRLGLTINVTDANKGTLRARLTSQSGEEIDIPCHPVNGNDKILYGQREYLGSGQVYNLTITQGNSKAERKLNFPQKS